MGFFDRSWHQTRHHQRLCPLIYLCLPLQRLRQLFGRLLPLWTGLYILFITD